MIRGLRRISVTEAVSYLALLAATVVKQMGGTEIGVQILGPIHGVLFLVFAGMILQNRSELGWSWAKALIAMVIGSLPLGGFWVDQRWLAPLDGSAHDELAIST